MTKKRKKKCTECWYLKKGKRQQSQQGRTNWMTFYCTHEKAHELQSKMTRNGGLGFVCFSDMKFDKPTIKTAPKWCPRNQEDN